VHHVRLNKAEGPPFEERCLDGLAAVTAAGYDVASAAILGGFPYAARNPFQDLLYSEGLSNGVACLSLSSPSDMLRAPSNVKRFAHYHWLQTSFFGLKAAKDAMAAAKGRVAELKRLQEAGVCTLWTVHNTLSHNAVFPDEEIYLRTEVAANVDHIHIMNPETLALCGSHYKLPADKVFELPHPSYQGVYGCYVPAAEARLRLGIAPDELVFLLFGSLSPQKGTRQFLSKIDQLQKLCGGRGRVLIAGAPGDPEFMEDIYRLTAGRGDVSLHLGHIEERDIQLYMGAANATICPYTSGLNSGVINTALTFGVPVVAPAALARSVPGACEAVFGYADGDINDCLKACANVAATDKASLEALLSKWAADYASKPISSQFFDKIRGLS
jgi:beta-1,4-mannosyltransferase